MISSLRGKLIYTDNTSAVIECGGVGFRCTVTQNTLYKLPKIGEEAFLFTYLSVREDALDLFGFYEEEEMNAFKLIIAVNGVGPKLGIAILSEFTPSALMLSIASGDAKTLTSVSGVGTKSAQRIVLELKDKVGAIGNISSADLRAVGNVTVNSASAEAVAALVSLGYTQSEASLAVGKLDQTLPTDELIKQSLRTLARGL